MRVRGQADSQNLLIGLINGKRKPSMATPNMVTFILSGMAINASCTIQLPPGATWVLAPTSGGSPQNGLTIMPTGQQVQFGEIIFTPTSIYISGSSGGATNLILKTWLQTEAATVTGQLSLSSGSLSVSTNMGQTTYQAGSSSWTAELS